MTINTFARGGNVSVVAAANVNNNIFSHNGRWAIASLIATAGLIVLFIWLFGLQTHMIGASYQVHELVSTSASYKASFDYVGGPQEGWRWLNIGGLILAGTAATITAALLAINLGEFFNSDSDGWVAIPALCAIAALVALAIVTLAALVEPSSEASSLQSSAESYISKTYNSPTDLTDTLYYNDDKFVKKITITSVTGVKSSVYISRDNNVLTLNKVISADK